MEIAPKEIDEAIIDFCKIINKNRDPAFIPFESYSGTKENYCFENVNSVISNKGGTMITGWAIWKRDNMYLEAEAHAILQTRVGEWVDITPHTPNEGQILFLQDDNVKFQGVRIPSAFYMLTNSELVSEYIQLVTRIREIEDSNRTPDGKVILLGRLREEYLDRQKKVKDLEVKFEQKAGRNDKCPCGSGLKYKKCCGKFR